MKLTDAVQEILSFGSNNDNSMLDMASQIRSLITPVLYASCFFNGKYKSMIFSSFPDIKSEVERFVLKLLPVEGLSIFSDYENERGHFQLLFDTVKEDPKKMWYSASLKENYSKTVCDIISELMELPAFLPSIELEEIWKEVESSNDEDYLKRIRLQLLINDILLR